MIRIRPTVVFDFVPYIFIYTENSGSCSKRGTEIIVRDKKTTNAFSHMFLRFLRLELF